MNIQCAYIIYIYIYTYGYIFDHFVGNNLKCISNGRSLSAKNSGLASSTLANTRYPVPVRYGYTKTSVDLIHSHLPLVSLDLAYSVK